MSNLLDIEKTGSKMFGKVSINNLYILPRPHFWCEADFISFTNTIIVNINHFMPSPVFSVTLLNSTDCWLAFWVTRLMTTKSKLKNVSARNNVGFYTQWRCFNMAIEKKDKLCWISKGCPMSFIRVSTRIFTAFFVM